MIAIQNALWMRLIEIGPLRAGKGCMECDIR